MAEHTSECRPDTGCRNRIKPSDLLSRGSYTLNLAPARMQQALSRAHTLCNHSRTCYLQEAENSKGHKTSSCSAAMAGCGAAGSTNKQQQQQPARGVWAAFWGGTALPAPSSFTPKAEQRRRRKGGGRLDVWQRRLCVELGLCWQRVCLRLAAVPVQRRGLPCRRATSTPSSRSTAQKQRLSINSERPAGSAGNYV